MRKKHFGTDGIRGEVNKFPIKNEYLQNIAVSIINSQSGKIKNVIIGKDVYVGPGAIIRGDWGKVIIEDGCNVQENCVIHMFPGTTTMLKKGAHLGHGCVIHGAYIGEVRILWLE